MGRGRGSRASASAKSKAKKKQGLSCPDTARYTGCSNSDSDSVCSDSECSECYDCAAVSTGPRSRRRKSKSKSKITKSSKSSSSKANKNKKKSKRRTRDSSSSCSCSDCMSYSSDDSYNCPPARGRKCSTC